VLLEEKISYILAEGRFCSLWKMSNKRHSCTQYSSRDGAFLRAIRKRAFMSVTDGGHDFVPARKSKLEEKYSVDCFARFGKSVAEYMM
jgi:hypothetical protein